MQELFETPYFCQDQKQELFELARPFEGNPVLQRFSDLAKELQVGSCSVHVVLLRCSGAPPKTDIVGETFLKQQPKEQTLYTGPLINQLLDSDSQVALPISYFERSNNAFFNSLAVFDADGSCAGRYRKSHIPDGTGCAGAPLPPPRASLSPASVVHSCVQLPTCWPIAAGTIP